MSKCFIYEKLNDVNKSMTVKEENGMMKLSGVFGVCGVMNNNKRVYSKDNYKKMVESLQQRIVEEGCPGELEHPNSMNINLERISHKIDSIKIDENGVVSGEITLLNTPQGKIAQAIVKGGLPLFVSSRAMGDVDSKGNVTLEMLRTYDLVGTPGFSQAKLHLNESQVAHTLNESMIIVENTGEEINTFEDNMTNNELIERIETLESMVESLETQIKSNNQRLCEAVEKWVCEEYSQEVENWVVNEVAPEIEGWVVNEVAPEFEGWVVNEVAPEIEKWITEEYSEGLQKWLFEEYGTGLQNWIINEYSPETQNYMEKCFEAKENKKSVLSEIDEALKLIQTADAQPKKKVFESAVQTSNEPVFVAQMPADARAKWNMASEAVKNAITMKARLHNLTNESALENFWNNVSWEESKSSVQIPNVTENEWERKMINMFKRN